MNRMVSALPTPQGGLKSRLGGSALANRAVANVPRTTEFGHADSTLRDFRAPQWDFLRGELYCTCTCQISQGNVVGQFTDLLVRFGFPIAERALSFVANTLGWSVKAMVVQPSVTRQRQHKVEELGRGGHS